MPVKLILLSHNLIVARILAHKLNESILMNVLFQYLSNQRTLLDLFSYHDSDRIFQGK